MSSQRESASILRLRVFTSGSPDLLLQGLDRWLALGLIEAIDITGVTIGTSSPQPLACAIRLEISTTEPSADLLQGLQTWVTLGLLANTKLVVDITTSAEHPSLMQGLDYLVGSALLPPERLQEFSQQYLTCKVPEPAIAPTWAPVPLSSRDSAGMSVATSSEAVMPEQVGDFVEATVERTPARPMQPRPLTRSGTGAGSRNPTTPSTGSELPNPFAALLSSLMAELSVRWLLFLGVFLVVISSSVLAASQWQRFPAVGQYLILLTYTLTFWAASLWTSHQPDLTLTAQTLRLVTLLLVPINTWAMDTFNLWQSPLTLGIAGIAAIVLGGVTWQLFQFQPAPRTLPLANHLALSGLHWGWGIAGMPGVAVYGGVVTTALLTAYQTRSRIQTAIPGQLIQLPVVRAALIISALLILIGRALFIAAVPATQLGLAVGICGFLMAWLDWQYRPGQLRLLGATWEAIGLLGLGLGWLLAVTNEFPGQVLAVLGLAGWVAWQRLERSWQRRDLLLLLLIGLNSLMSLARLLPTTFRATIVRGLVNWANVPDYPGAIVSILLLPYIALILLLTTWLHHHNKAKLARFGDCCALALGLLLTAIGAVSPALLTTTLLGNTILLASATRRRLHPDLAPSVTSTELRLCTYLTHLVGVSALLSGIDWAFPRMGLVPWAAVLLGGLVLEWGLLLLNTARNGRGWLIWLESSWYVGIGLASISYFLLAHLCSPAIWLEDRWVLDFGERQVAFPPNLSPGIGLLWFLTPLMLSLLASHPRFLRSSLAGELGTVAVLAAQVLTVSFPGVRLLGFAAGLVLMLVNTARLQTWQAAVITVGMGVVLVGTVLAEGRLGITPTPDGWLLTVAIGFSFLWLLRLLLCLELNRRDRLLLQLYARALDGWAVVLCWLQLSLLPKGLLSIYNILPTTGVTMGAIALTMIVPALRSWQLPRRPGYQWLSILALSIAQFALFGFPRLRLITLGIATVLMLVHTYWLRQVFAAIVTVGYGLVLGHFLLLDIFRLSGDNWWLATSLSLAGLWLGRDVVRRQPALPPVYIPALDTWAILIWGLNTLFLTIHASGLYWEGQAGVNTIPSVAIAWAATFNLLALVYRGWQSLLPIASTTIIDREILSTAVVPAHPPAWVIYGLAWSLETVVMEILGFANPSLLNLALANGGLALITQLLGNWWEHRRTEGSSSLPGLHTIPLMYGAFSLALRWGAFTAWTGLLTLVLSLVAINIGKRRVAFKPLIYSGLIGISVGLYECLLYQLLQLGGDTPGDGWVILAALGTAIAIVYGLLCPWLQPHLGITTGEVRVIAHLHWGMGSLFLALATIAPLSLYLLWFGIGLLLVGYAFFQGRNQPQASLGEMWEWLALAELLLVMFYILSTPPGIAVYRILEPILAPIACGLAYLCHRIPWSTWGWQPRPLLIATILLPLVTIPLALDPLYPPSFLVVAAFYLFLTWERRQIRYTYLSVALADLLLWRWLDAELIQDPLWYSLSIGCSLLYLVQVEPSLKPPEHRESRFLLRLVGSMAICGIPLLEQTAIGILPAGLGLAAIVSGLALRVRAYLFVGAATFLLTVLYQLGILVFEYPLTKWILGLLAGIFLLYISATFETRREQMRQMMRQWLSQLDAWE